MSRSRPSPHAEANTQIRTLQEMTDAAAQAVEAVRLMEKSRHLEVIRAAIRVLRDAPDPAHRPALHRKYEWCETQSTQRDGSGYIRAEIVRALQPIVQPDDLPLLQRAMLTYQMVGIQQDPSNAVHRVPSPAAARCV